jgi:hypothetical protein
MVEGPPTEVVHEKPAEEPEADPEVETLISEFFEEPPKSTSSSKETYTWLAVAIAAVLAIGWWAFHSGLFPVQAAK